jgi:hypothetical protein
MYICRFKGSAAIAHQRSQLDFFSVNSREKYV